MKQTSLIANKKAEEIGLKLSHQKRILEALKVAGLPINYLQIAEFTGLTPNQVHRRMGELESVGKVIIRHSHGGYSHYAIPTEHYPNTAKHFYLKKQFEKWQKQAKKYEKFLGVELIELINNK